MERIESGPPDRVRVAAELQQRCAAGAGSVCKAITVSHLLIVCRDQLVQTMLV